MKLRPAYQSSGRGNGLEPQKSHTDKEPAMAQRWAWAGTRRAMGQGLSVRLEWRGRSLEALTVLWKHTRPGGGWAPLGEPWPR